MCLTNPFLSFLDPRAPRGLEGRCLLVLLTEVHLINHVQVALL